MQMKISIVQPDTVWEDKSRNFAKIEKSLDMLKGSDIVILPEMFNTGFTMNTEGVGEPPASETFDWMIHISERGNFGICGSYIVRERGRFFNRWVFVTPEKKSWHYDKRHLFRMGNEEKAFTPGKKRITFRFRGVRILPNVCYDLRFPVWSRNRNDYDLLINSACWPAARHSVWITLLKARAIENQCFVAGATRIGTDGNGVNHRGDSMIVSPYGEILASAGTEETIISSEISLTELSSFRKKFPVLKDADDFSINL
jgi:predicted amidohydrolase